MKQKGAAEDGWGTEAIRWVAEGIKPRQPQFGRREEQGPPPQSIKLPPPTHLHETGVSRRTRGAQFGAVIERISDNIE